LPKQPEHSGSGGGDIPKFPETTPPIYRGRDYDFVLQGVFDIQKSIGGLEQAVRTLTEQQKEQGKKLDSLSHKINAAIAVLVFIGTVLTFFSKFTNDLLTHFFSR
jgi:hypothetical protein